MGQAVEGRSSIRARLRLALVRLISIADYPDDDDDARLKKRVGIAAGYFTIVAPFGVTLGASTRLVGWAVALSLSLWSAGNLAVLARTKRFERYVVALIAVGSPFTLFTTVLVGGVTHNGGGLVWAFLVPAYALLALGPSGHAVVLRLPRNADHRRCHRPTRRWLVRATAVRHAADLLRPEHRGAADGHVPSPPLRRHPAARGRGALRGAPDERDSLLDRDPTQANGQTRIRFSRIGRQELPRPA